MKKREPISHIMSKEVHQIQPHQNLLEAREIMDKFGIRHLPVVEGAEVTGILSRTDIMRASYGISRAEEEENKAGLQLIKVEAAMTPKPVVVDPNTSIREVAEVFSNLELSALPVVENDNLTGIVTTSDLIRFLLEQY